MNSGIASPTWESDKCKAGTGGRCAIPTRRSIVPVPTITRGSRVRDHSSAHTSLTRKQLARRYVPAVMATELIFNWRILDLD
jgi:hypothetical protein